jgi:hypothetical protein
VKQPNLAPNFGQYRNQGWQKFIFNVVFCFVLYMRVNSLG